MQSYFNIRTYTYNIKYYDDLWLCGCNEYKFHILFPVSFASYVFYLILNGFFLELYVYLKNKVWLKNVFSIANFKCFIYSHTNTLTISFLSINMWQNPDNSLTSRYRPCSQISWIYSSMLIWLLWSISQHHFQHIYWIFLQCCIFYLYFFCCLNFLLSAKFNMFVKQILKFHKLYHTSISCYI